MGFLDRPPNLGSGHFTQTQLGRYQRYQIADFVQLAIGPIDSSAAARIVQFGSGFRNK
jgi:hypothetical protein